MLYTVNIKCSELERGLELGPELELELEVEVEVGSVRGVGWVSEDRLKYLVRIQLKPFVHLMEECGCSCFPRSGLKDPKELTLRV